MKKLIMWMIFLLYGGLGIVFAQDYLFYADGCEHCAEILEYVEDNNLVETFDIDLKEVRLDKENVQLFTDYLKKHDLNPEETYVPFLVIDEGEYCDYMEGTKAIAHYYASKMDLEEVCIGGECEPLACDSEFDCDEHFSCQASAIIEEVEADGTSLLEKLKFLGILLPAALADSINPCAFAVILLLLMSIISLEKNYKRAFKAGMLFALAVFISYFLMGLGIFSLLGQIQARGGGIVRYIVTALALVIGLLNIKDFFWFGKGMLMEVPMAWRPAMQKVIKKVTSPWSAFVIGLIVSMFLLPCTSGPYFVVLGYLASEAASLQLWGYFCLFLYNIIFVLPMVLIVLAISKGRKSVEELGKMKNKYKKEIHLAVGLLMFAMAALVWFSF